MFLKDNWALFEKSFGEDSLNIRFILNPYTLYKSGIFGGPVK